MGIFVESEPPAAAPTAAEVPPSEVSKRVLTVPTPPSWLASSIDLVTGCSVSDVEDTIPGALFDELFGDDDDQR